MIDAATRAILIDLLQRESCSLLKYTSEAFPRTTSKNLDALAAVQQMVKEEEYAAIRLARLMQKHRISFPPLGAYPSTFTTMNFVSLDYMVPLLIAYENRRIDEITRQLDKVTDPEVRHQMLYIIELKTRHAQQLEGFRVQQAA